MRRNLLPRWAQRFGLSLAIVAALIGSRVGAARAQAPGVAGDERVNEAMKRAAGFFLEKQDPKTGGIHENMRNEVTMTALSLLGLAAMASVFGLVAMLYMLTRKPKMKTAA